MAAAAAGAGPEATIIILCHGSIDFDSHLTVGDNKLPAGWTLKYATDPRQVTEVLVSRISDVAGLCQQRPRLQLAGLNNYYNIKLTLQPDVFPGVAPNGLYDCNGGLLLNFGEIVGAFGRVELTLGEMLAGVLNPFATQNIFGGTDASTHSMTIWVATCANAHPSGFRGRVDPSNIGLVDMRHLDWEPVRGFPTFEQKLAVVNDRHRQFVGQAVTAEMNANLAGLQQRFNEARNAYFNENRGPNEAALLAAWVKAAMPNLQLEADHIRQQASEKFNRLSGGGKRRTHKKRRIRRGRKTDRRSTRKRKTYV